MHDCGSFIDQSSSGSEVVSAKDGLVPYTARLRNGVVIIVTLAIDISLDGPFSCLADNNLPRYMGTSDEVVDSSLLQPVSLSGCITCGDGLCAGVRNENVFATVYLYDRSNMPILQPCTVTANATSF